MYKQIAADHLEEAKATPARLVVICKGTDGTYRVDSRGKNPMWREESPRFDSREEAEVVLEELVAQGFSRLEAGVGSWFGNTLG